MILLKNGPMSNPFEARTVAWVGLGLAGLAAVLFSYRADRRAGCVSAWYDDSAKRLAELPTIEASAKMSALLAAEPGKYKGNATQLAKDTFEVLWATGAFSRDECSGWGDAKDEVEPLAMPTLLTMAVAKVGVILPGVRPGTRPGG
jgi:hypothetical protein